jgi:hypothetical protein
MQPMRPTKPDDPAPVRKMVVLDDRTIASLDARIEEGRGNGLFVPAPESNRNWARPQEDPSANHPNRAAHKKTARERGKRYNRATAQRGKPQLPMPLTNSLRAHPASTQGVAVMT